MVFTISIGLTSRPRFPRSDFQLARSPIWYMMSFSVVRSMHVWTKRLFISYTFLKGRFSNRMHSLIPKWKSAVKNLLAINYIFYSIRCLCQDLVDSHSSFNRKTWSRMTVNRFRQCIHSIFSIANRPTHIFVVDDVNDEVVHWFVLSLHLDHIKFLDLVKWWWFPGLMLKNLGRKA